MYVNGFFQRELSAKNVRILNGLVRDHLTSGQIVQKPPLMLFLIAGKYQQLRHVELLYYHKLLILVIPVALLKAWGV